MPLVTSGVQYSGLWTRGQQMQAVAAGTWTGVTFLFGWGYGQAGQLGLGNVTNYSSPKQVGSQTNWLDANPIVQNSIGLKSDGTLWAIGGNNTNGCLGLGNTTYYSSPKQIGALTTWASIAKGYTAFFMVAIKNDGTLWSWGQNNFGQLGLGNTTNYSSPKQVGALTNWKQVALGYSSVIAVKTDGTIWSWGRNHLGQLGQGNITNYSSPKQIGGLTNWLNVACGYYHAISVKTDGTLWSWGYNVAGQLGLNNLNTAYSSPKQVGALTNWLSVACGGYNSFSIKTNNYLWAWGGGSDGALGLGNTNTYSSPVQVGSNTWSKISAAGYASGGITTDNKLYTWGRNTTYGGLGLGDLNNRSSPTQVGSNSGWTMIRMGAYHSFGIGPK